MKRINFIIVFFLFYSFCFISCDQNVISSNSKITKKSESFQRTDTSSYSYTFSTRKDLSMKDGYVCAHVDSGTGDNTLSNWVLSQNYTRLVADGGFEADIFCGKNVNRAGIQLFEMKQNSFNMYFFEIFSDGRFYIQYDIVEGSKSNWYDVIKLDATKSHIDVNKFNFFFVLFKCYHITYRLLIYFFLPLLALFSLHIDSYYFSLPIHGIAAVLVRPDFADGLHADIRIERLEVDRRVADGAADGALHGRDRDEHPLVRPARDHLDLVDENVAAECDGVLHDDYPTTSSSLG